MKIINKLSQTDNELLYICENVFFSDNVVFDVF